MALLNAAQLAQIMPKAPNATVWSAVLSDAMTEFKINTAIRSAAFLAQVAQESSELKTLVENLNYSAAGLRATWPNRFTSDAMANTYARQPERIADFVYAGRLGNGNEASGDGWRFRGRGLLQITGRSNYQSVGQAISLPLDQDPARLELPEPAARSAGYFWSCHGLNALSDLSADRVHDDEDFIEITKQINGGTAGLAQRKAYWAAAKRALGVA